MAKIKLNEIAEDLKKSEWQVLSDKYINLDTPMTFQCNEGHQVTTTWRKLRHKLFCPVCDKNENKKIEDIKAFKKSKNTFRILALDQSSKRTGYSIYDNNELVAYGVFITEKDIVFERITDLCDWVLSMTAAWKPDLVGIEDVQYNPNKGMGHDVFKLLAQIMGAVIITVLRDNVSIVPVNISKWRGHCGVKGRTRQDKKRSAQELVKNWFDVTLNDDAADAICIGKYLSETQNQNRVVVGEWIE